MVTIIFEAHGTTFDNEQHVSSGWFDVELSPLGIEQSKEMGTRYTDEHLDAVFCSDLQRSYRSAEIAFHDRKIPIVKDARLRECDYGELTQKPSSIVDAQKPLRIERPFPRGGSYLQTSERMKSFLSDLLRDFGRKTVMVIGHRATQYGLEHWIHGISLKNAITAPWKWQPGWTYELRSL